MHALPRPIQLLLALLLLLMAAYPLFGATLAGDKHDFFLQQLTSIMILAIVALGLDLLVGVSGMVSLASAAFFGMASGAFAAAVPQGWTQGTRPASSSAMILPVISS